MHEFITISVECENIYYTVRIRVQHDSLMEAMHSFPVLSVVAFPHSAIAYVVSSNLFPFPWRQIKCDEVYFCSELSCSYCDMNVSKFIKGEGVFPWLQNLLNPSHRQPLCTWSLTSCMRNLTGLFLRAAVWECNVTINISIRKGQQFARHIYLWCLVNRLKTRGKSKE